MSMNLLLHGVDAKSTAAQAARQLPKAVLQAMIEADAVSQGP